MVFVETSIFTRRLAELLTDRDYGLLQRSLADHPDAGDLIEGGGGIRKLRWAQAGKGKRGGVRVIYYWRNAQNQIYLLYLFAKSANSDLTSAQLKHLSALAKAMK